MIHYNRLILLVHEYQLIVLELFLYKVAVLNSYTVCQWSRFIVVNCINWLTTILCLGY